MNNITNLDNNMNSCKRRILAYNYKKENIWVWFNSYKAKLIQIKKSNKLYNKKKCNKQINSKNRWWDKNKKENPYRKNSNNSSNSPKTKQKN